MEEYCEDYEGEYEYEDKYEYSQYEHQNVPEMDFSKMAYEIDHVACIISAVRRSGKTHLLNRIIYEMAPISKWDVAIVYSETCCFSNDFEYIPEKCKRNGYDSEHLGNIIKQQGENIKDYNNKIKKGIPCPRPPRILIILDDVIGQEGIGHDRNIANLFILGRHLHISCFYLTQHLNVLKPAIRRNADALIIFKDPNRENRKIICNTFMSLCNDDDEIIEGYVDSIFKEPYKCAIVCVYKSQFANSLQEYVYEFKAPEEKPPPYKIGSKKFWDESSSEYKGNKDKLGTEYTVQQQKGGVKLPDKEINKFIKKMKKENNRY
jgi:hypothetical protein